MAEKLNVKIEAAEIEKMVSEYARSAGFVKEGVRETKERFKSSLEFELAGNGRKYLFKKNLDWVDVGPETECTDRVKIASDGKEVFSHYFKDWCYEYSGGGIPYAGSEGEILFELDDPLSKWLYDHLKHTAEKLKEGEENGNKLFK